MSRNLNFNKLRTALYTLGLEQARQLHTELGAIVQRLERQAITPTAVEAKGREVVEAKHISDPQGTDKATRLYQLERVRCGKEGCKCAGENGELHGPYWYVYWREDGKLKSRYVGKKLRRVE